MLLIKTYLAPSKIQGIGLFANENIKCGRITWKWNYNIDSRIPDYIFKKLPNCARHYISIYGYKHGDFYYLCGDNTRFINHSNNPNILVSLVGPDIALKDIKRDEELTVDYRLIEDRRPYL